MNNDVREIGVAVVFDHQKLFASTFAMLLERTGFFSAVNYFSVESDVIVYFRSYNNSRIYLFTEFFIPGSNVIQLLADLRRFKPSLKVIITTSVANASLIKKIMTHRVDGLLSKYNGAEEVIMCIDAVIKKQVYVSPYIMTILSDNAMESTRLTSRELEILNWIARGKSTGWIASSLNITASTVLTHRKNMLTKSGFNSIMELLAFALKRGLVYSE